MSGVGQGAECGFDVVPAPFVFKAALDEFGNESATTPRTGAPVDLLHQIVFQDYV